MPNGDHMGVRMSVAEEKLKSMEDTLDEHHEVLKNISEKVDGVQRCVSKQNGSIPGLKEGVDRIEKSLNFINKKTHEQEISVEKNKQYLKLLWGIVIPLGLSGFGLVLKVLFFN